VSEAAAHLEVTQRNVLRVGLDRFGARACRSGRGRRKKGRRGENEETQEIRTRQRAADCSWLLLCPKLDSRPETRQAKCAPWQAQGAVPREDDAEWFTLRDPTGTEATGEVSLALMLTAAAACGGATDAPRGLPAGVAAEDVLPLRITAIAGKNLKAMDRNGFSDPYLTFQAARNPEPKTLNPKP